MSLRPFSCAALLACLLLAGCTSKPPAAPQEAGEPTDDSEVTTILEGWVMDEESVPLVEAEILIDGLDEGRLTNHEGGYRFVNLPPGEYLIVVSKTGYLDVSQFATVQQGFATVLNFTLTPDLGLEPYSETARFTGHITCHVFVGDSPETGTYHDCGANTPTNTPANNFDIDPAAVQILVEVEWVSASAAADLLLLTVQTTDRGAQNIRFAQFSGPTGMRAVVNVDNLDFYFPNGGPLEVRMAPGPSVNNPTERAGIGAVVEQDFTVHFTQFFVQPRAESFTAIEAA